MGFGRGTARSLICPGSGRSCAPSGRVKLLAQGVGLTALPWVKAHRSAVRPGGAPEGFADRRGDEMITHGIGIEMKFDNTNVVSYRTFRFPYPPLLDQVETIWVP